MPRRRSYDPAALHDLALDREQVITHDELVSLGVPRSTVTHRVGAVGPWQRLFPGVVLTHRGTPTRREVLLGCLRYSGDRAVLTGHAVLALHGVRAALNHPRIRVLVPAEHRRQGHHGLVVERTRRLPRATSFQGLPCAPLARALVDACRDSEDLRHVRELVAEAVQRGKVSLSELTAEVRAGARQRSALTRAVLREMEAGVRSVAEQRAREVLLRNGVRAAEWNVDVYDAVGGFVARPDAWWDDVAVALQVDSMRWHLSPEAYQRTQRRQRDLTAAGALVVPVSPAFVVEQPQSFVKAVDAALRAGAARPRPTGLVVLSPAA